MFEIVDEIGYLDVNKLRISIEKAILSWALKVHKFGFGLILLFSKVGSFTARKSQTNSACEGGNMEAEEEAVIGFWSAFGWLDEMTVFIALLSEYVVDTIENASDSWGLSVSFLSIILLPIVGNAAEHAGAIIFAFKNMLIRRECFIAVKVFELLISQGYKKCLW
ncbi:vacuolar cation/proton exchanger 3-like [Trifolium pratense]|uniref:vacuolar cation/proton exchanger 3-like n=1 Tax=Trifolium pratense TaxID=57577 RepID=UPI001E690465|nr:vacuolar cation/proton exchanger 3-like [Trifolium pratense]XP_045806483.1 vacuolar cation/proton exchanger 3-like [Trifolium pratense]XP_045806484.1 vacuolar cation/proton exchanger 3-like [Trifolium pratense]